MNGEVHNVCKQSFIVCHIETDENVRSAHAQDLSSLHSTYEAKLALDVEKNMRYMHASQTSSAYRESLLCWMSMKI